MEWWREQGSGCDAYRTARRGGSDGVDKEHGKGVALGRPDSTWVEGRPTVTLQGRVTVVRHLGGTPERRTATLPMCCPTRKGGLYTGRP